MAADNGIEIMNGSPLLGKKVVYFLQPTTDPVGHSAILPALQTGGSISIGGDSIDEQTKFGRVVLPSTNEDSIDLETAVVWGDRSIDVLKNAKHEGNQVKVWRVVIDKKFSWKDGDQQLFPAMFGYGVVDSLDIDDGDDLVKASYTLNIVGMLRDGSFAVSDDQLNALTQLYDFEQPGEKSGNFGY